MENQTKNIQNILNSIQANPNPEWVVNTRNNLIDKMNAQNSVQYNLLTKIQMKAQVFSIIALALIVMLGGVGLTLHAAQTSKPGDALFGLNKAIENLQRNGITNPEDKLAFEQSILEKRQQALNEFVKSSDPSKISEAEKELAEQQVNFNRANSNRGTSKNPISFPETREDDSNEDLNETDDSGHDSVEDQNDDKSQDSTETENHQSNENETETETETENEQEQNSNRNGNSGSNSESETENESESHKGKNN